MSCWLVSQHPHMLQCIKEMLTKLAGITPMLLLALSCRCRPVLMLCCRIKMCRRVAHRASTTAATVTTGVADTSLRVADGIVARMGNSNYGQYVYP